MSSSFPFILPGFEVTIYLRSYDFILNLNLILTFSGEAIPLEYNLAGLNAISFDKGCYVGQELIARTHHRRVIRKCLISLKFLDDIGKEMEQKVAPGSDIIVASSGKKTGTVTTALGCRGLGLLRLEEAFKCPGSLTIQGEDVNVETIRPEWWPAEWYLEHQQHSAVVQNVFYGTKLLLWT
ncbi:unnamed protein product [Ilex paraguariensis]|uniref:CAF17 C-terminal domain-containing protein n=1 Tax=Ilex paraguariensis TaxID=185542 RepID=A0ABC8TUQ2_9AQUA